MPETQSLINFTDISITDDKGLCFLMLERLISTFAFLLTFWSFSGARLAVAQDSHQEDFPSQSFTAESERLVLRGPFAFYWKRWIDAKTPEHQRRPDAYVKSGLIWNGTLLNDGTRVGSYGYASYELLLRNLAPHPRGYQIFIPATGVAHRALLLRERDQRVIAESQSGLISDNAQEEQAAKRPSMLRFAPEQEEDYRLLIQVSNHTQYYGGLWTSPVLGIADSAAAGEQRLALQNTLAIGVLSALGFYLLLLWKRRPEQTESLWLSVGALSAIVRMLATNETLFSIFPDSAYALLHRLEYATMPWGTLAFYLFFESAFPSPLAKRLKLGLIVLGLVLVALPFLSSPYVYSSLLALFQIYVGITIVAYALVLTQAWRQGQEAIGLALTGCLITIVGAIFDTLVSLNLFPVLFYLTPFCIAFFLVLQSQVVAKHAALAFQKAEELTLELKEQERARTLFFHNTSHELRTPLNGIIGFLELVQREHFGKIEASVFPPIAKTLRLAESLKFQVNTILDLAKSKRGELSLKIQRFRIDQLLEEANTLAEGLQLKSEKLSYQASCTSENNYFVGDREKIFTILRNLIGNAIKFRDPERSNHVTLTMEHTAQALLLTVSDTGIGIPHQFREKIFEEFGQIQADARRQYEGTGLGLSMVRDLVRLMGGTIELDSEVGRGSCFRVRIPEKTPADISLTLEPAAHSVIDTASLAKPKPLESITIPLSNQAKGWKICVIDDNETNCEVISGILQADGYSVQYAIRGHQGLELMHKDRPDVLLLDMMMPEMSGEDVLAAMRKDSFLQEIPVILITARASEEDRIEGLKLGADDYLPKPIFAAELRLRVKNMIERHRLLKESERAPQEAKLVYLGELFGDLSHELKNILLGSSTLLPLEEQDAQLSASVLDVSEELQNAFARALLSSGLGQAQFERAKLCTQLHPKINPAIAERWKLWLAELSLSEEDFIHLWNYLMETSLAESSFVTSQVKIFRQYQYLMSMMARCSELTQSVLMITRSSQSNGSSSLASTWHQVESLLSIRTKTMAVRWHVSLVDVNLVIEAGPLMQILLNLTLNAIDAIKNLPQEEQWISLTCQVHDDTLWLDISNGGAPIPAEYHPKLFQRGFSTKGQEGTGIGLSVSRRLACSAGGDLLYIETTAFPCFRLHVKLASLNSRHELAS